jgi:Flp pilus assembly protein TadG
VGQVSVGKDERGTGLISTIFGVLMFLLFLLLGAHVLMHLYAASVLTANAFDAARLVSGAGADHARAQHQAEAQARQRMGAFAERVEPFDWSATTADDVVLTVRADTPDLLPGALASLAGMDTFTRTVRLRVEVFR